MFVCRSLTCCRHIKGLISLAKLTLTDIGSTYASTTALNDNYDLIEAALENTLSRDGTTPNSMSSNLDLNSHRAINLAEPVDPTDATRKQELDEAVDSFVGRNGYQAVWVNSFPKFLEFDGGDLTLDYLGAKLSELSGNDFFIRVTDDTNLFVSNIPETDPPSSVRLAIQQDTVGQHIVVPDPAWVLDTDNPPVYTYLGLQPCVIQVRNESGTLYVSNGGPYLPDYQQYGNINGADFKGDVSVRKASPELAINALADDSSLPTSGNFKIYRDDVERFQFGLSAQVVTGQVGSALLTENVSDENGNFVQTGFQHDPYYKNLYFPNPTLSALRRQLDPVDQVLSDNNFSGVANLSLNVVSGDTYFIRGRVRYTTGGTSKGCKLRFHAGNSATFSSMDLIVISYNSTNVAQSTTSYTALDQVVSEASLATGGYFTIEGLVKCSANGQLNLQYAQVTTSGANPTTGKFGTFITMEKLISATDYTGYA